jgi:dienelactone hydrolase
MGLVLLLAGCQAVTPLRSQVSPVADTSATFGTPAATATMPAPSALPIAVDPAARNAKYDAGVRLFDYDAAIPLDLRVTAEEEDAGIVTQTIAYASATGETVSGVIAAPRERDGLPGVVWLGPGPAVIDRAQAVARQGAIAISIDPPQARRTGSLELTFTERDRDEMIELMVELRRAVDVLVVAGADPDRIGFVGYSWGAAMGATLAGLEHRIRAFVLMYADGGVVEHLFESPDASFREAVTGADREQWVTAMEPLEGLYYVLHASPSAILFQSGLHDESVASVSAHRLQDAASQPKELRWYDSGHDPTPDAPEVWCDQGRWLADQLGLHDADVEECAQT